MDFGDSGLQRRAILESPENIVAALAAANARRMQKVGMIRQATGRTEEQCLECGNGLSEEGAELARRGLAMFCVPCNLKARQSPPKSQEQRVNAIYMGLFPVTPVTNKKAMVTGR